MTETLPFCRKSAQSLRQASTTSVCWQRGFAEDKKSGREGTTGEELSGDPNRVPKKGDQDKEGKGAMKVNLTFGDYKHVTSSVCNPKKDEGKNPLEPV